MSIKESSWIPNLGVKGWGVTACCIGFYIFYNFFNNAANTLFGILTEMYGWQTTDLSFVVTIGGWVSLLGIVAFGALGKKIGARNVSIVGLVLNIIAFVILALMNSFAMYAVGVILFFISMVAYAVIGLGMLGSSWFPHKKGMFMGMATMGMTICGAAINPIILGCAGSSMGISALFWGCAALCAVLIVGMLFVKNNPEEAGAYPDNDRSITREQLDAEFAAAQEYKKNSPWTLSRVLKTPQTWLIGFGWGFSMMAASGTMALLVPTLASFGRQDFDTAWSPIQVVYNILNFAGVSVMAIVAASFGQPTIMTAMAVLCVVSLVIVCATPDKQIASHVSES